VELTTIVPLTVIPEPSRLMVAPAIKVAVTVQFRTDTILARARLWD
jgi:hypothetical protein